MPGYLSIPELIQLVKSNSVFITGYPYHYGTPIIGIILGDYYYAIRHNGTEVSGLSKIKFDQQLQSILSKNGKEKVYSSQFYAPFSSMPLSINKIRDAITKSEQFIEKWKKETFTIYETAPYLKRTYSPLLGFYAPLDGPIQRYGDILGLWDEKPYRWEYDWSVESEVFCSFFNGFVINKLEDEAFSKEIKRRESVLAYVKGNGSACLTFTDDLREITLCLDKKNDLYSFELYPSGKKRFIKYPPNIRYAILDRHNAIFHQKATEIWDPESGKMSTEEYRHKYGIRNYKHETFNRILLNNFEWNNLKGQASSKKLKLRGGITDDSYIMQDNGEMYNEYDTELKSPALFLQEYLKRDSWIIAEIG